MLKVGGLYGNKSIKNRFLYVCLQSDNEYFTFYSVYDGSIIKEKDAFTYIYKGFFLA